METPTSRNMNTNSRIASGANDITGNLSSLVSDITENFSLDKISEYATELKDAASEVLDNGIDFVKRNPLYTVMGAAAIAYTAGTMLRSRKASRK